MKIIRALNIPQARKQVLNKEVANHLSRFSQNHIPGLFKDAKRNKLGLWAHGLTSAGCAIGAGLVDDIALKINFIFGAKINYDFIPFLRNISKRKAAILVNTLKKNGINNPDEIYYAVQKCFSENGMPLYPLLHPRGMKKIAENGTYLKSFETGCFPQKRTYNKDWLGKLVYGIIKKFK